MLTEALSLEGLQPESEGVTRSLVAWRSCGASARRMRRSGQQREIPARTVAVAGAALAARLGCPAWCRRSSSSHQRAVSRHTLQTPASRPASSGRARPTDRNVPSLPRTPAVSSQAQALCRPWSKERATPRPRSSAQLCAPSATGPLKTA